MVADSKGILAMDESHGTCKKRFDALNIDANEENRRSYRDMLVTTDSLSDYVSGAILFDETIPHQYKTAFQQQTKLGWEHLFMGKMASGWKQCWPDKKHWWSSSAHTFMEWGRVCWSQRNRILYGKRKDQYK